MLEEVTSQMDVSQPDKPNIVLINGLFLICNTSIYDLLNILTSELSHESKTNLKKTQGLGKRLLLTNKLIT